MPENSTLVSTPAKPHNNSPVPANFKNLAGQYAVFLVIATIIIGFFSLVMIGVASFRNDVIDYGNYQDITPVYNGPISQQAPSLGALDRSSTLYKDYNITPEMAQRYQDNTSLVSTDGNVIIKADFVKKGLSYQPTYRTQFKATYLLQNFLSEKSLIAFDFPFPVDTASQEISNARLLVDGKVIPDSKGKITLKSSPAGYTTPYGSIVDGLHWEGLIPANSSVNIEIDYDTVGLSTFNYTGIANPKKSQDFKFAIEIQGIRSYNIISGLSKDSIEYGDNSSKLIWNKKDLYSAPTINMEVGSKISPGSQVARVYFTMAPIYLVFALVMLFLAAKFAKPMKIFDLFLLTVLFVIYFPLVHYLASFTIDPTMEIFAGMTNIRDFSMPLYGAFGLSLLLVGGLIYRLIGKITNFKFASKMGIPAILLFLGFFPLAVTIPEQSMLLVLLGLVAFLAIVTQVRFKMQTD